MCRNEKTDILHIRRLLRFAFDVLKSGKFHSSLSKTKQRDAPVVLYIQPFLAIHIFRIGMLTRWNNYILHIVGLSLLASTDGQFPEPQHVEQASGWAPRFIMQLCEPYYKDNTPLWKPGGIE